MSRELAKKQAQAQAIYMSHLARIASEHATKNIDKIAIDPQERALVDVTISQEQVIALMRDINAQTGMTFSENGLGLEKALGRKISSTTSVSLYNKINEALDTKLNEQLEKALTKVTQTPHNIMNALVNTPKSSIIALHQEFHFHMGLVFRVYNALPALKHSKWLMEKVHQEAMLEINELIMASYAKALTGAMKDEIKDGVKVGKILDIAKLNKSLDKARKEILPQAHSIMMNQIIKQTRVVLGTEDLKNITIANQNDKSVSLKHLAEGTTATTNDVLHLDIDQGLATLIAGSENTAHDRIKGKEFAHRQLITHRLTEDGTVVANKNPRIQIRTPSPVLKKGLNNNLEYIADVMEKLTAIKEQYALGDKLGEPLSLDNKKPRAFIYNSYTAFNDTADDFLSTIGFSANLQTQSARHILRGAHMYNVTQLRKPEDKPVFCFVQNISVNGFGDTLGYASGNDLKEETTLMAEIALLHTLYDKISSDDRLKINSVFDQYQKYLARAPEREAFFSDSIEGKAAINEIQSLKAAWQNNPGPLSASPNTMETMEGVTLGLKNLMANNLHFDHKHAKLFQALSVYAEEASIGGCKSGNERAQSINGRVAILDSLSNGQKPSEGKILISEALDYLACCEKNEASKAAEALEKALDAEFNRAGLHGGTSLISLADQGAAPKVEAKKEPTFWNKIWPTSRNGAEAQASIMTNLHQSKAGNMQAHKGLTEQMRNAWEGHPKSVWERMKSAFGTTGAVLSIFPFLFGIVVAMVITPYSLIDNYRRKSKTLKENLALREESYPVVNLSKNKTMEELFVLSTASEPKPEPRPKPPGISIATSLQTIVPNPPVRTIAEPLSTLEADRAAPSF